MTQPLYFVGFVSHTGEVTGQGFLDRSSAMHQKLPVESKVGTGWRYRTDTGELFIWDDSLSDDSNEVEAVKVWLKHRGHEVSKMTQLHIFDDGKNSAFHRSHGYYQANDFQRVHDRDFYRVKGRSPALGDSTTRVKIDALFETADKRYWLNASGKFFPVPNHVTFAVKTIGAEEDGRLISDIYEDMFKLGWARITVVDNVVSGIYADVGRRSLKPVQTRVLTDLAIERRCSLIKDNSSGGGAPGQWSTHLYDPPVNESTKFTGTGWINPKGKFFPVGNNEAHADWAVEHFPEMFDDAELHNDDAWGSVKDEVLEDMFNMDWRRITWQYARSTTAATRQLFVSGGPLTREQTDALIKGAIEGEFILIHDLGGKEDKNPVLYRPPTNESDDYSDFSYVIGQPYWMDSGGRLIRVSSHVRGAEEILRQPFGDADDIETEDAYQAMFQHGYARVVINTTKRSIFVEVGHDGLKTAQLRNLKDIAIERHFALSQHHYYQTTKTTRVNILYEPTDEGIMNKLKSAGVAGLIALSGHSAEPRTPNVWYTHGTGTSMAPVFSADEYIRLEKVPFDSLKEGDIVAYWNVRAGQMACHRILRKSNFSSGWVMRGDGNGGAVDLGLLTAKNYHGKVTKDFGSGEKGRYAMALDQLNHSGPTFEPTRSDVSSR